MARSYNPNSDQDKLQWFRDHNKMDEIFSMALELAQAGVRSECKNFLDLYSKFILSESPSNQNLENATKVARSNLGYFAGYYGLEVQKIIYEYYNADHPLFGKSAMEGTLTPEEAFILGLSQGFKSSDRQKINSLGNKFLRNNAYLGKEMQEVIMNVVRESCDEFSKYKTEEFVKLLKNLPRTSSAIDNLVRSLES